MDSCPGQLHVETVFDLVDPDGPAIPADVDLRYRTTAPLEIVLDIALPGTTPVRWLISRELLREGLLMPSGHGDVRLWPLDSATALLELRSGDGQAMLRVPRAELSAFLENTDELVPPGDECSWLDVDAVADRLARLADDFDEPDRTSW